MKQHTAITEDKLVRVSSDDGFVIAYDPFVETIAEQKLDLTKDKLRLLPDKLSINFQRIDYRIREHFKAWFSFSCSKYANSTLFSALNLYATIRIPTSAVSGTEIEEAITAFYKEFMRKENYSTQKSMLRSIYGWFVQEGFSFFDEDFYDFYLAALKFGTDDGKGKDVIMEMQDRGPLTIKEQRIFNEALSNVAINKLSSATLQGYLGLKLGQALGVRDVQVINLKVGDFSKNKDGIEYLKVPRAKQRGQSVINTPRKSRPITKATAKIIVELIKRYTEGKNSPVDPSWSLICSFSKNGMPNPKENVSRQQFMERRRTFEDYLDLGFKVTNRRLRKTFCTKLIAKGAPLKVVAELMDHSDLQQLEVYYRQTHHVASKLDKVLRDEARDILDAFNGKIIHHGDESQSGQQIFAPTGDVGLHLIGSCGSGKPCSLNPPLSCYGCASLEAFEDADHKSVVDHMVSEVKSVFGEKHAIEILQHKNFLAATQLVNKLEEGAL